MSSKEAPMRAWLKMAGLAMSNKSWLSLGDFAGICAKTPLPMCFVVQTSSLPGGSVGATHYDRTHMNIGMVPRCYSRTVDIANTAIFQLGNAFVNILALCVILIISYNIRFKYTAIGRSEYGYFFQLCFMLICMTLVVDCGVSPPGTLAYPYLAALQIGLAGACSWALAVMGFLGFRLWEDGTRKSMLIVRGVSMVGFLLGSLVSAITFTNWIQHHPDMKTNTTALFVVMYGLNGLALLMYSVCQLVVSIFVLSNFWMTGSTILGVIFITTGQVLMYTISYEICEGVKHYLDGLFIGSICNVFALMMIYKTWDISTDEDLEFSVSISVDGDIMYNSNLKL
ncbi:AFR033Cp [Eremothecium gossypii ATCC 10895]|uniref:Chitin synthase export chaperone n=1 Tax=Eremothecium gossypii (strain ATCC 10895 / CBS 109.51 / FGSC 9923 / NRRL Y-1056) TaxID=284811 RepID=CHS7_EREGS|nr:AFR033Cp [Eremothecium gossypii ATCC 10895]Q754N9.1 RecName: Full=Chitin synthase export chaperone [Eremothecium gossypii ATCC 10895]AAS53404.1 AFR033Cp [Eremothecium gossypii ATCC 10895]AEY97715.1 FAFR033Cp [Eremothecium gossypii FDAG1]